MDKIKEKIKNEELLYGADLENFCAKLVKDKNLSSIVEYILFKGQGDTGFSSKDKMITINLNDLWYSVKGKLNVRTYNEQALISNKERKNNYCKKPNNVNIYNIATFYHELRHAYQYDILIKLLEYGNISNLYEAILYKNLLTSVFCNELGEPYSSFIYNKYHNFFFDEYDANINGYMETINLFNSFDLPSLKKLLQLYNKLIAMNLHMLYKDIKNTSVESFPALNMIKLYNALYKINGAEFEDEFLSFDNVAKMDMPNNQIDRLRLGLKLDEKTSKYI